MSSPRTAKKSGTEKRVGKPAAKTAAKPAVATASPATATAQALAIEIERGLADGRPELIAPEALQELMAALCKCYTAQLEAGGDFGALLYVRFLTGFPAKLMAKIFSACQAKRPAAIVTPCFHDGQPSLAPFDL